MARADGTGAGAADERVRVDVVYCAARGHTDLTSLVLPGGATLAEALRASGLLQRFPGLDAAQAGVWSRPAAATQVLRDGDRVEFYRPLQVEPMAARRERHRRQATARKPRP